LIEMFQKKVFGIVTHQEKGKNESFNLSTNIGNFNIKNSIYWPVNICLKLETKSKCYDIENWKISYQLRDSFVDEISSSLNQTELQILTRSIYMYTRNLPSQKYIFNPDARFSQKYDIEISESNEYQSDISNEFYKSFQFGEVKTMNGIVRVSVNYLLEEKLTSLLISLKEQIRFKNIFIYWEYASK